MLVVEELLSQMPTRLAWLSQRLGEWERLCGAFRWGLEYIMLLSEARVGRVSGHT